MEGSASAAPEGPAVPQRGIFADLFRAGHRFGFFQAVRLLESFFPDAPPPGTSARPDAERIRFRPDPAIVFPPADVRSVTLDEEGAEMRLTFMGLYGVASPLPVYLYEDIATEADDTLPLRHFLDLFNHRLYSYFYRAWKKYRPSSPADVGRDDSTARFLALAGLGTPGAVAGAPVSTERLAGLAGLLNRRVRNAEGLHTLLTAFTDGLTVEIVENVVRRVQVAERPRLGGSPATTLGGSALVGATVLDAGGKFRVALGPMGLDDFEAYLPGGPRAEALGYLVRLYAPDFLDFDVLLRLKAPDRPALRLGDRNARLGENTWVGRPQEAIATERIVTYA